MQFAAPNEVPTIDLYNDMRAREADTEEQRRAISNMGFTPPEAPIVNVMRLTILRDWFELEIAHTNEGVAFDPQWDAPFSLENSLEWNIARAPTYDDAEIKKLAEACGRSFDQIRAAQMNAANDDRKDLIANHDAILDLYQTCAAANLHAHDYTVLGENGQPARVVTIDPITQREGIEMLIDELPLQLRWRLGIKLYDLMADAAERSIKQLVRPGGRGSRDAAADIRLIDAARLAHYQQLDRFDKQHGRALDEIADRGAFVAELPDPEQQPIVVAMEAQRAREDASHMPDDDILLDDTVAPPAVRAPGIEVVCGCCRADRLVRLDLTAASGAVYPRTRPSWHDEPTLTSLLFDRVLAGICAFQNTTTATLSAMRDKSL